MDDWRGVAKELFEALEGCYSDTAAMQFREMNTPPFEAGKRTTKRGDRAKLALARYQRMLKSLTT